MPEEEIIYEDLFTTPLYVISEPAAVTLLNLEGTVCETPQVLCLLNSNGNEATDSELLVKLFDWVGIARQEVAVFNPGNNSISFSELNQKKNISCIIAYDILPAQLGLQMERVMNRLVCFMNCKIIFTASFPEVQKNEKIKREFFDSLSLMFNRTRQKR
jgi:hypothetical protein